MKLFYKIIVPIAFSFVIFFSILLNYILNLEGEIISKLQNSVHTISTNEFKNKKSDILSLEKDHIEFISFLASKIAYSYLYNYDDEYIEPLYKYLELKSIEAITIDDSTTNENFITLIKDDNKAHRIDKLPDFFNSFEKIKKVISKIDDKGKEQIYGYITIYYNDFLIDKKLDKQNKKTLQLLKEIKEQSNNEINIVFRNQTLLIILIAGILSLIIFFLIQKIVLHPLNKLKRGLDSFFLFLQDKKNSTKPIELYTNDEFGDMAKSLNENIDVSLKLHEEITNLNVNLEELVNERTQKVTTLLNNAGQGFLSFGNDFIIDDEYSHECINIIGMDISKKLITDILFDEEEQKKFFKDIISDTLSEEEDVVKESLISLLPSIIIINRRDVKLEYKILTDNKFMIILTDITSQKLLEEKIKEEKETLKMIVAIVSNREQFFDLKNDYNNFCNNKLEIIDQSEEPMENLNKLYRMIHTYKGSFLQIFLSNSSYYLHNIETLITNLIKNGTTNNNDIFTFLNNINFKSCMKRDLKIIKNILGDDFLDSENYISVSKKSIKDIELKIDTFIKNQNVPIDFSKDLIRSIHQLTSIPLINMLNIYPKMTYQLSKRLDKEIYKFEVIGDKNLIIPESFKPFFKSLIHIFRNSIDHGIEDPETRANNNKDEIGTISCSFEINNNILQIIILDDGKGVNIEKIKEKLISEDIDITQLSDNDIYTYIFKDNFSTKGTITDISGRGVGMSTVKYELEQLNGFYEIKSGLNVGTKFIFKLPVKADSIFHNLVDKSITILLKRIGIDIINRDVQTTYLEKIEPKDTTVIIEASGYLESTIAMSYDNDLLSKLAQDFVGDEELTPTEQKETNQSAACEVTNIVVGKSFVSLSKNDITIITPPKLLKNKKELSIFANEDIIITTFKTSAGDIQVYFKK